MSAPPDPLPLRLVAGLGNPGSSYAGTRHNVGFEILDRLARRQNASWKVDRQFRAEVASANGVYLCKPLTFMNLSGQSIGGMARFYKWDPEQCLSVVDDVSLEIGRLRFRKEGSAGGHNGLKSIIEHLQTNAFPRLRVGVGDGASGRDLANHVLSPFSKAEREKIDAALDRAAEAVEYACSSGLDAAMNLYNTTTHL